MSVDAQAEELVTCDEKMFVTEAHVISLANDVLPTSSIYILEHNDTLHCKWKNYISEWFGSKFLVSVTIPQWTLFEEKKELDVYVTCCFKQNLRFIIHFIFQFQVFLRIL